MVQYAFEEVAGAACAADYKIGFVNTERLFREAAPAKRAQQKLEKEFSARDAEQQKLSKQVRDLQTMLDRDGPTTVSAPRSRCLRQSVRCEAYSPSRRSSTPTCPFFVQA